MPRVVLALLAFGLLVTAEPARPSPSSDRVKPPVRLALAAREVQEIELDLGDLPKELGLRLDWEKPPEWQDGLVRLRTKRKGSYIQADDAVRVGRGTDLTLEAQARCGCVSRVHETVLALVPVAGQGARTVRIPLEIAVGGSSWSCWSGWLLGFLGGGGLVFYLGSMFTHSRILSRGELVRSLVPLQRQEDGSLQPLKGASAKAHAREALRHFRWPRRLGAWLRANPLVFGLPRKGYREVLRLELGPSSRTTNTTVESERDFLHRVVKEPAKYEGRLYAVASDTGRALFRVVPARGGKVGRLVLPRMAEREAEKWAPKVLDLRVTEDFVYELEGVEGQVGEWAGWRVTRI